MRSRFKSSGFAVAVIFALPFILFCRVAGRFSAGFGFQGCSQCLSLIPGLPGKMIRKAFYHLCLEQCSRECHIDFGTIFSSPKVRIGRNVYIGAFCNIAQSAIGDDVLIGSGVHVLSKATHDFSRTDIPIRLQGREDEPIHIGKDTWIGNNAIIMANVGEKCVIGAGSVVTKDVAAYAVAAGNPAGIIKKREAF